jgi:uncharacterized protein
MRQITIIITFLIMISSPVATQEIKLYAFPPTAAEVILVEEGGPEAKVKLGRQYQDVEDYKEAFKWYKLAAEQGYADAQLNIGLMYSHGGMGVLRDYNQAYMWLNIGATNGSAAAKRWRKKVAGKMTSKRIETAKAMAQKCMKSNYKTCG